MKFIKRYKFYSAALNTAISFNSVIDLPEFFCDA